MCNSKERFRELKKCKPVSIILGDGHKVKATKRGKVSVTTRVPEGRQKCTLHDVLYVPELAYNLFSVSRASGKGKKVIFSKKTCQVREPDGRVLASGKCRGSLYHLELANDQYKCEL